MKRGFILLTVLALAAMLLAGCALYEAPTPDQTTPEPTPTPGPTTQPPIPGPSTGTIKVLVTDAPGNVSEVNVTVSEVEVHKAGVDGEPGYWKTLPIEEETFNLIALQDITMLLAEGEVESGKYTQLRMTVFNVIVKTDDGPEDGYQAKVPSDKLKFVRPFTLEAGDEITLTVDIDAAKSVVFTGGKKGDVNKVIFKPVVKLLIEHEAQPGPPAPTVNFDPDTGPVGTVITVNLTGWVADEDIISVTVGGEAATYDLEVDVGGNLWGTITVPEGLDPGTYSIVITGATSGEQTFPDAFTVTATATFDPTSGPVETVIDVTGTGWVAEEDIDSVEVGGETATYDLEVDVGGNLWGTITVPEGLDPGTYSIVITGVTSGEQTFPDAFTVTATATFDPTSGPVETVIDVTGTGWVADEDIDSVEVGGEAATYDLEVDVGGNLSGTIAVPEGLDPDTYNIVIEGEHSGPQTFPDAFTVT